MDAAHQRLIFYKSECNRSSMYGLGKTDDVVEQACMVLGRARVGAQGEAPQRVKLQRFDASAGKWHVIVEVCETKRELEVA